MLWTKYMDWAGWVHSLPIPGQQGLCMKVEKSAAGDYFACVFKEGDVAGDEVIYFDTLSKARNWCEKVIVSGEWVDYA